MLMNMRDLLAVAQKNHFAIPAFNTGNDQLLKVVMEKIKELNSPVIPEMSPDEFNFVGDVQIQVIIYEAAQTDVPIYIHLDHGDPYETAICVIRAGITSVMIDASALPYEENTAVTKRVVETAHIANVSAESRLRITGTTSNPIEGGTRGAIYTVSEKAKQLIENIRTDTLAIAIGTAHGIYPKDVRPELRIDILKDITNRVGVSPVLHGGSSSKDEGIAAVADNGICKISTSSDIKVIFYTQCRETLNENSDYRRPLETHPGAIKICGEVVEEKIRLFKSNNKVKHYY